MFGRDQKFARYCFDQTEAPQSLSYWIRYKERKMGSYPYGGKCPVDPDAVVHVHKATAREGEGLPRGMPGPLDVQLALTDEAEASKPIATYVVLSGTPPFRPRCWRLQMSKELRCKLRSELELDPEEGKALSLAIHGLSKVSFMDINAAMPSSDNSFPHTWLSAMYRNGIDIRNVSLPHLAADPFPQEVQGNKGFAPLSREFHKLEPLLPALLVAAVGAVGVYFLVAKSK